MLETAGAPQGQYKKHGAPELSAQNAGWYILRCGAGLEFRAEKTLRDSGWDVFLPRERKWRASLFKRRASETDYPRFPPYLFIAVAPPRWPDWRRWPLSSLVRGVLGMDGQPVALASDEIERLAAEDGRHVAHEQSVPLHRAFAAGDQVRVLGGAWRDWVVCLDAIDERGARIAVPLFGRPAEVVLPLTWLEPA